MRDPLAVELKLYEIGMRNGLRGRSLERYVSDMHREFRVPRVPEPPPAPARQTVEPREVRGQAPRPQGRGRQLPLFPQGVLERWIESIASALPRGREVISVGWVCRSPDPLTWEIRFYEIGMKHGLTGQTLENWVARMHRRHELQRVPEPPPPEEKRPADP